MSDRRPQLKEEYAPEPWKRWRAGGSRPDGRDGPAPKPPVDIVAVQGLAASYDWTWTKKMEDGSRVMWLRDLLPRDIPGARVLTFEYDSKWLNDPSLVSLRDCADRLIESVLWDRTHLGETKVCRHMARRPLILLGHSFGGLVVKMALVRAAAVQQSDPRHGNYQSFLRSVAGVLFLGTPHGGSNFALLAGSYGRFLSKIGYGVHLQLIQLLRPLAVESGGTTLDDLEEDFQSIRRGDYLSDLITYYFWEGKKIEIFGFRIMPVVDKKSACYGAPPGSCIDVDADHKGMNKFGSRQDSNYFKVLSRLRAICLQADSIVDKRLSRLRYDGNDRNSQLRAIQEWLSPPDHAEILSRLQSARLAGTCSWALRNEALRLWLTPDNPSMNSSPAAAERRSVWISGKAGSGKSVATAYLHARAEEICRQRTSRDVQCAGASDTPSCDEQGADDRFAALYSPLHQNLSVVTALKGLIDDLLRCRPFDAGLHSIALESMSKHPRMTLKSSIALLTSLLRKFHTTYVIVDNVDECPETKEVARVLLAILEAPGARLLFAARKDGDFLAEIKGQLGVKIAVVDITEHNHRDITEFVKHGVSLLSAERPSLFSPRLRNQVQDRINKKADGMFHWVQLILRDLGRHGRTDEDVVQILEQFPSDLNETYSRAFTAMLRLPEVQRRRVIVVLKWLVATSQPIALSDLRVVIRMWEHVEQRSTGTTTVVDMESTDWDDEEFFDFLSPLVEVSHSSGRRSLRIFHHSFRQWIIQQHVQFPLAFSQNHDHQFRFFFLQSAHFLVATICLLLLSSDKFLLDYLRDIHSPKRSATPLITYAGDNWSYHVRMSGSFDAGQGTNSESVDNRSGLLILLKQPLYELVKLCSTAIAAICSVLGRIPPGSLQHLPEAIAVRDLQGALLDAAECVSELQSTGSMAALQDLLKTFCRRNVDHTLVGFRGFMWDGPGLSGEDINNNHLDFDLMTTTTLDIAEKIQQDPDFNSADFVRHFGIFRKAIRSLREVSIFLAVEPVRSYIYGILGNNGVSPLPVLAYTAAAMDVLFLVADPQHGTAPADLCDFRRQFHAQPSHPLYGPIMAARYELQDRGSSALGEDFYRSHIADHFQLKTWEWRLLQLTTIILYIKVDGAVASAQDTILEHWLTHHVKFKRPKPRGETLHETVKLLKPASKLEWRSRPRASDICIAAARTLYVSLLRLLTIISPPLQTFATSCLVLFRARSRLAIPILRQLVQNTPSLPAAVALYAIRLQWFPGMLPAPRRTPLADLLGVLRDPFNHTAASNGWIWSNVLHTALLLLAEVALGLAAFLNAVRIAHPDLAPYIPRAVLGRNLAVRARNLTRRYPVVTSPVAAPALVNFLRLIFLERTVYYTAYLAYDIAKASAMLVQPSTSIWEGLAYLAAALLPLIITDEYGVSGLAIFLFQIYIATLLWRSLALPPAIRLAGSHALQAICAPVGIPSPVRSARDLARRSTAMLDVFWLGTRSFSPRFAVAVVAVAVLLLFAILLYVVTDPLHLRRAGERSARAEQVARRVSGVGDPVAYLRWERSRIPRLGRVPLASLYGTRRR
ncbi:hypothetical protein B0T22DRAFT_474365 [Podospora appendiculata]|uniref:Nephrocystin 3-like N-terminal domain-containing protein n=1 Tax=Podospora appendiculata TaxID=314037 RepID=A0AAE1C737_9PEZI|nr:hypothetical protein B0T22DRAFT_474365 [Podospora appendiculata]